ncbi:MAG: glycosyltransferase [Planctomycetota bacterium]
MTPNYCLIIPCRDEEEYAERTLRAIVNQSLLPAKVLIVDDGSTDRTPAILKQFEKRFPFIRVITRQDRGERQVGPGVVDAFYAGYDSIDPDQYKYICKLDLDLDLPRVYFQRLIEKMESNPRIGTCSGKPFFPASRNRTKSFEGELVSEGCGDEMSVGMAKLYRTVCFQEIGGFVREVMWDGIDCHRCRMKGWLAESYDDPEIRFLHLRAMGSSQHGILTGRFRHGFGQYFMGTGWTYMMASAISRMKQRPRVFGGAAMAWGYMASWLRQKPRYQDAEFRRFLRQFQRACLWKGKRTATQLLNAKMESQWRYNNGQPSRLDPPESMRGPRFETTSTGLHPRPVEAAVAEESR